MPNSTIAMIDRLNMAVNNHLTSTETIVVLFVGILIGVCVGYFIGLQAGHEVGYLDAVVDATVAERDAEADDMVRGLGMIPVEETEPRPTLRLIKFEKRTNG